LAGFLIFELQKGIKVDIIRNTLSFLISIIEKIFLKLFSFSDRVGLGFYYF